MEPSETVEVVPSVDENGNTLPDTPSATPEPTVPAVPEPVTPTEPELFELPDGRKVDGATLTKEWKENFLPDYTRKSQELAKRTDPGSTLPTKPADPLADPNWQPQTYAELIDIAKQRINEDLAAKEQERIDAQLALETQVTAQLDSIKKEDPSLNENALFQHATKYGFRDLKFAYQNMKDMNDAMKKVQTITAQNIAKRNDPVSGSPGATGARPDPSNFASASEYLRSLK